MATRLAAINLWTKIIILSSLLALIKSQSSESNVNKTCDASDKFGSDVLNFTQKAAIEPNIFFEHYLNFSSHGISFKCRSSVYRVEQHAKHFDMHAIKLLDASAKITSGVLSGNANNFGDFDECLGAEIDNIRGKYCLSEIQFETHTHLKEFRSLILANELYRNELDDISHIVPRISTILWGICVPSTCSHKDVQIALRNYVDEKFGKYLISSSVKVAERNCQIKQEFSWGSTCFGTKLSIALIAILLIVACVSTAYDSFSLETKKNEFFTAFSMVKNFNEIILTDISTSEIPSLNGIRCFCTIMIILGHKCMEICIGPILNKVEVSKFYASYYSIPHRSMFLYTEIFLMLSGLLLTHSLFGKLNRGQKISITKEIASRYFRFMPPVIALMLVSTYILPLLGSGPLWPDIVETQADICKNNGWRNLLMIQNWFGFENICNFNLHHVGTDFVIFLALVPILSYVHRIKKYKMLPIVILGILSTIARFYVSYVTDMSIYIRFGSSVKQMMDTANFMYGIPPYRFTSYSIGILMGYTLRHQQPQELGSKIINFGWLLAIISMILVSTMATVVHVAYSPLNMAIFSAFTPILFCAFFAWIIYVSHHKSGNKFTRFFEWKYFKISSALSYALYLVQFQVFNFNVGTARGAFEYSFYNRMIDMNEITLIIVSAFLMTLLVELPFGNIKKIVFDQKKSNKMPELKSD